ncbi:VOC family protein [Gimesia maris]|uniref:Glyoxalase-like domain protein n=1 Tax=Gimesia maris TaxID=122 RepID=A0ABX5YVQ1_9PLAN|nr:VOC family protein [Gimesia maris]EDL61318.1 glyoxalase family protein [Gimesia maris DSM 8797]QEG19637.1 Glyoxalase-like domain protein [Gimesia maris]QGQ27531.1 VOC family protein [Gimesia maris]
MKNPSFVNRELICTTFIVLVVSGLAALAASSKTVPDAEFAKSTVDFGIVVSDIDKSLAFYKDVLGLKTREPFEVTPQMGVDSGLSDNLPFKVYPLVLENDSTATNVKLMQFKDTPAKKVDNSFIHSSLGVSYLTIYVKDTTAALARAKAFGVEPVAKGPIALPEGFPKGIYLTLLRDPDGNLIELVGPKK